MEPKHPTREAEDDADGARLLDATAQLCRDCNKITWNSVTECYSDFYLINSVYTKKLRLRQSACPVCQILATIMPPISDDEIRGLAEHDLWNNSTVEIFDTYIDYPKPALSLRLLSMTSRHYTDDPRPPRSCHQQGFIEAKGQREGICVARLIDADNIRYDVVKEWIDSCKSRHGEGCQPSREKLPVAGLRVIDCHLRSVLAAPEGCVYVALSYVWGHTSAPGFRDGPRSEFVRVVEDSIIAATALGYRYLWVDQYCINQQDAQEMQHQISMMGSIYANAELAFIAAAGSDSEYGLPGVGTTPRQPQARALVGQTTLTQIFPNLATTLKESKWATRGWTLQEAVLSRRRVFFTDQQVAFVCSEMYHTESVKLPPESRGGLDPFSHLVLHSGPPGSYNDEALIKLLEEYSRRQFTNDSDVPKACLGILAAYRDRPIDPVYNVWAVPIAPITATSCQPKAKSSTTTVSRVVPKRTNIHIYWRKLDRRRRRSGIPTWSWLAWSGPTSFEAAATSWRVETAEHPTAGSEHVHECQRDTEVWFGSQSEELISPHDIDRLSVLPDVCFQEATRYMHFTARTIPVHLEDFYYFGKTVSQKVWTPHSGMDDRDPYYMKGGWRVPLPWTHDLEQVFKVYLDGEESPPDGAIGVFLDHPCPNRDVYPPMILVRKCGGIFERFGIVYLPVFEVPFREKAGSFPAVVDLDMTTTPLWCQMLETKKIVLG